MDHLLRNHLQRVALPRHLMHIERQKHLLSMGTSEERAEAPRPSQAGGKIYHRVPIDIIP